METVFVKAAFEIDCDWEGLNPAYRIYVNDELFTERTWIWNEYKLQEILQIQAPPGEYRVRLEPVEPTLARFTVTNYDIQHGPAAWVSDGLLQINQQ